MIFGFFGFLRKEKRERKKKMNTLVFILAMNSKKD